MIATATESNRNQVSSTSTYERQAQGFPPVTEPGAEPTAAEDRRSFLAEEPLLFLSLVVTAATLGSVAGLIAIILAIVGLSGVLPASLFAVAGIVLGAGFLTLGAVGLVWAHMFRLEAKHSWDRTDFLMGAGAVLAILIAGLAGSILSLLNLLFLAPALGAIAVILLGFGLAWHSRATRRVTRFAYQDGGQPRLSGPMAINALSLAPVRDSILGVAGIVLGILAFLGFAPVVLGLVGMLVMGGALTLTISTICGATLDGLRGACSKS
jgi:hypothetical protein